MAEVLRVETLVSNCRSFQLSATHWRGAVVDELTTERTEGMKGKSHFTSCFYKYHVTCYLGVFSIGDVCFHKPTDDLNLVIEHFLGQAGVGAKEDRGVHDGVGSGKCCSDATVVDFWKG